MEGIRVNLGCGLNAANGWVNIDKSPSMALDRLPGAKRVLHQIGVLRDEHMAKWPANVRRHDITKGLPFHDAAVETIYSSHTLEHVYLDEAQAILRECRRVLRPDGMLRLALPDAEELARRLLETGDGRQFNEQLMAQPLSRPKLKSRVMGAFGAHIHRWQPTRGLIRDLLTEVGFAEVTEHAFLEGRLPGLTTVEHRRESIFMEARCSAHRPHG